MDNTYKGTEYIDAPAAIELFVCQPLFKSHKIGSTEDQLLDLQRIVSAGNEDTKNVINYLIEQDKTGDIKGYVDRVNTFPIPYDHKLILWIATHYAETKIEGCLVIAYYLQWWAFRRGVKKLSLGRVIKEVFPMSVISPEAISEVWENQKVRSVCDNLIDYATTVQSFMPGYAKDWTFINT